ncbi:hypothetical protein [Roseovarius sp.]|uniref:hypothetical protein n=1 Tax=Roseovarius sp. TaxID=1486281 RepID=UPI00356473F5
MALIDEIKSLACQLEALGHQATTPCRGDGGASNPSAGEAPSSLPKAFFVADHLNKIKGCDALLIANFPKGRVEGYVGTSALMEAAMAYALGKGIFLLNPPADTSVAGELEALGAIFVEGELGRLKLWRPVSVSHGGDLV